MMERHFARGLQQDLFNSLEIYAEVQPSFPPEDVSMDKCANQLSHDDIDNACLIALSFLGLGAVAEETTRAFRTFMQSYFLNATFREKADGLR